MCSHMHMQKGCSRAGTTLRKHAPIPIPSLWSSDKDCRMAQLFWCWIQPHQHFPSPADRHKCNAYIQPWSAPEWPAALHTSSSGQLHFFGIIHPLFCPKLKFQASDFKLIDVYLLHYILNCVGFSKHSEKWKKMKYPKRIFHLLFKSEKHI